MAASPSRLVAIETLFQLEKTRKPVSVLFDRIAEDNHVQTKDRQLAMKIIYGVLRNRDYLDQLLGILCSRPVKKIKPFVHQSLLSGLYQIFFLDRIPPSAAINETVNVIKSRNLPSQLQGFVNGVLRQSVRQKDNLPTPHDHDANNRPVLNHPAWLTDRWSSHYGEKEMVRICLHNNRESLLSVRTGSPDAEHTLIDFLTNHGIDFKNGAYAPNSIIISDYNSAVRELPGIRDGLIHVQDQAAQLATMLLAPFESNLAYLDGCAGLGGKTTHIRELLQSKEAYLTAVEPDHRRFRQLETSLEPTLRTSDITLVKQTLQEYSAGCSRRFDRILIDAPCSGTGVIGRHPDIRWNRNEQDLAHHASRQRELLSAAADLTAANAIVVYSTCSIEPEENEMVVENFLRHRTDFYKSNCGDYLPDSCATFIRNGCFAPLPGAGIDGFFAARLVKRTKDDSSEYFME